MFLTHFANYIRIANPNTNLVNLIQLDMGLNFLTGSIPTSIGMLQKSRQLDLNTNNISGEVPHTLCNITQVNELYLGSKITCVDAYQPLLHIVNI